MLSAKPISAWLQLSKFVALFLFVMAPILAGISAGALMNTTLFWLGIGFSAACLSWFIIAVILSNRLNDKQQPKPHLVTIQRPATHAR